MESVSPWFSIWIAPKATILRTVAENPKRGLWFLATLLGVLFLFNIEQSFALGYSISLLPLIALAFFLAPPCGFFLFYLLGGALYLVGKVFGGKGSFVSIRATLAWSLLPLLWTVLLWIILIISFRVALFQNFPENFPIGHTQELLLFGSLMAKLVVAIWCFVIFTNAFAEVQQFSVIRAIINIVFSAVSVIIVSIFFWWGIYLIL